MMLSNPDQESNASSPMVVIVWGMTMLVSPVHPENALLPIDVTEFGIMVF